MIKTTTLLLNLRRLKYAESPDESQAESDAGSKQPPSLLEQAEREVIQSRFVWKLMKSA
ncbi:MAG: hypothetical protein RMM98_00625 [Acidobacteriota bacterium]|nr:hypothetical protein [Blastocatellia bacterium]MDW8238093.1 hypothetical protein [Acidobacteriota bacterium]